MYIESFGTNYINISHDIFLEGHEVPGDLGSNNFRNYQWFYFIFNSEVLTCQADLCHFGGLEQS
jgi:hypothetical protein